jgi:hypothetical protein
MEMSTVVVNIPRTNTLPAPEVVKDFEALDVNKDGEISANEFIDGLRSNEELAKKFGLSSDSLREDGSRQAYEIRFESIDTNSTKTVDVSNFSNRPQWQNIFGTPKASSDEDCFFLQLLELLQFFGHQDLQEEDLAGLLSEFGYNGDRLRAILLKVKGKAPSVELSRSQSFAVNMYYKSLERPYISRTVPESAFGVGFSTFMIGFCCCAVFWAIIGAQRP